MFFQVRFEIQEASFWLLERGALLLTVCAWAIVDWHFVCAACFRWRWLGRWIWRKVVTAEGRRPITPATKTATLRQRRPTTSNNITSSSNSSIRASKCTACWRPRATSCDPTCTTTKESWTIPLTTPVSQIKIFELCPCGVITYYTIVRFSRNFWMSFYFLPLDGQRSNFSTPFFLKCYNKCFLLLVSCRRWSDGHRWHSG